MKGSVKLVWVGSILALLWGKTVMKYTQAYIFVFQLQVAAEIDKGVRLKVSRTLSVSNFPLFIR